MSRRHVVDPLMARCRGCGVSHVLAYIYGIPPRCSRRLANRLRTRREAEHRAHGKAYSGTHRRWWDTGEVGLIGSFVEVSR